MQIEIRYTPRAPDLSLWRWIVSAWSFLTISAGRAHSVRLFGWRITVYPAAAA